MAGAAETFGKILRRHRLAAGLTQGELARRAGVSADAVSALERGSRSLPHFDTVAALARALGLEAEERAALVAAARARPAQAVASTAAAPGPWSAAATPTNLPAPLTTFVGREREQDEVLALLGRARLVTLTGPGGVGKTRLALRVAERLYPAYPDGIWLVELASLADPSLVPGAVAAALGLRAEPGRAPLLTLVDHLRERRVLLVLDNSEHLIAACAELAEALLRACPHLSILATSREVLGISVETARRVPSLALPHPGSLPPPERLADFEAVRLFVERATVAQPTFALEERNAEAVAQICQRLEGIPLALELAAACLRGLSVQQIAARLDRRLLLLTRGSPTALPRQRTLRAAVEWSYSLLTAQEQTLFRRLSVFTGGWLLEAAEAVCSDEPVAMDDVLDLLLRLVSKSLVQAEERPDGETRYRLLETLQEYARERLVQSGEERLIRQRHADYFSTMAAAVEQGARGPAQSYWYNRVETEIENWSAAARWLARQGMVEQALWLIGSIGLSLAPRGHWRRVHALLAQLLAEAGTSRTAGHAKALLLAGYFAVFDGEAEAAQAYCATSLAIADELGDRTLQGYALMALGLAGQAGRLHLDQARAALERSVDLLRALGDRYGLGWALTHLGAVLMEQGDLDAALQRFQESAPIQRAQGDEQGLAATLGGLADVERLQGNLDRTRILLQESIALQRRIGDKNNLMWALESLGILALNQGDAPTARALYAEALALVNQMGDRILPVALLYGCARVAQAEAQPERALRLAGAAAAIRQTITVGFSPRAQAGWEACVAWAREALGEQAAAVWAEGQAMTLEQALAYALEMDSGTGRTGQPERG